MSFSPPTSDHGESRTRLVGDVNGGTDCLGVIAEFTRRRSPQPEPCGRSESAQAQATRAVAQLVLHGRQVPRLLQHHRRLLTRPDRRPLRLVLDRALPTDRWQGPPD